MVPGFVYESCTDQIRSEPIPQLIFGLAYLLILTRFVWPLQLPLSIKILVVLVGNSILLATDIESGDAPALCERSVA